MKKVFRFAPLTALLLGGALAAPTVLNVTATGRGYDAPASVQAGYVQLTLTNTAKTHVDVGVFRLKPGVTEAQFRAGLTAVATHSSPDADVRLNQLIDLLGGAGDPAAGQTTSSAVIHLTPGRYLLASTDSDDATHKTALSMGYYRPLTVTGPALNNAPAPADYALKMVDYHFDLPTNVTAGSHTWHLSNAGKEPHFALLARLLPGKTLKDAMTALMSSDQKGPPPVDFEHSVYAQVLTTGQSEDVTWKLGAGQYVVVCFIASKNGVEHAQMGMAQELVVR